MPISIDEQRKAIRTSSDVLVEISHPSLGVYELKAKDLSDSGVYVFLGTHTALPVGTVVNVRIKRAAGFINLEAVDMEVVRHSTGGMALVFNY